MQRTYRTPKGTELPLLNLRGKEYLEVKYRLVWFREEHADWAIETELLSVTDQSAYAKAVIKDQTGRVIATSHKFETQKGFPDFIEKAETGSIGRALALIGYGTQFCADELDEGDRVVDAPVQAPRENRRPQQASGAGSNGSRAKSAPPKGEFLSVRDLNKGVSSDEEPAKRATQSQGAAPTESSPKDPGEYLINFGKKYKGLKLRDVPRSELEGYIEWLEENASKKGLPLSDEARFLKVAAERFLGLQTEAAKH